jgi:hypothetical protein
MARISKGLSKIGPTCIHTYIHTYIHTVETLATTFHTNLFIILIRNAKIFPKQYFFLMKGKKTLCEGKNEESFGIIGNIPQ